VEYSIQFNEELFREDLDNANVQELSKYVKLLKLEEQEDNQPTEDNNNEY
jgi:hypothetical protein